MKKRLPALFLALLLSACSSAPAQSPPSAPPSSSSSQPAGEPEDFQGIYRIYTGYSYMDPGREVIRLDGTGALRGADYDYTTLYDQITGEPAFYVRTRHIPTGKYTEWGEPEAITEQALYGTDGTLLLDWQPRNYGPCVGGLLVSNDPDIWYSQNDGPADSALIDPRTGEVKFDEVFRLSKLDDNTAAAFDVSGMLLGTLDGEGNAVAGFPAPERIENAEAVKGRLVARAPGFGSAEGDVPWMILNREMRVVDTVLCRYVGGMYSDSQGPYARLTYGDDSTGIYDLERGEKVFSTDRELDYFDGQRAILSGDGGDGYRFRLCDDKGQSLAGPYLQLLPMGEPSGGEPADSFLAREGDRILVLDRSGAVTAQRDIPGLQYCTWWENGVVTCSALTGVPGDPDSERKQSFGRNLEPLLPEGLYSELMPLYYWKNGVYTPTSLWTAYRPLYDGRYQADILRADGTPVASSLTLVGDATEEGIAVVRGFTVGLIDYDGNWISENSVYQTGLFD